MNNYSFSQKIVWVTGASSGIGFTVAKELHKQGAILVVTARNQCKLQQLFKHYKNVTIMSGDLTSDKKNKEIVENINSMLGGLDCAVLIAGDAEYIDINNFSYRPFERMMNVNYLSMVKSISAALPQLRLSSAPYLVGMSSSVAWYGLPKGQAYSASKAAIRNLFQGLRIELSGEKISVSWICPGFVKTPLTDKNQFHMPLKINAEKAATIIIKDLIKQKPEIHFPKLFTGLYRLISILPASVSSRLFAKMTSV